MKIDAPARLNALTHPDPIVRDTILNCCLKFRETGIQITQQVIKAVDSYGLESAYKYVHSICSLDLDDPSADWLIGLMEKMDGSTYFGNNSLSHLTDWFVRKAPDHKLESHSDLIAALAKNTATFSPANISEELSLRAELAPLTNDEIYQKICSHLADLDEDTEYENADIPRLTRLIKQLDPADESLNSTILTELQNTLPHPESPFAPEHWNHGAWVIASGQLKIEDSVPTLLQGTLFDWDWLNEEVPRAIAKIASPTALHLTTDFYLQRLELVGNDDYDYVRSYLSGVFGKVESTLSSELAQVILQKEDYAPTRDYLAAALAIQLDSSSIANAIRIYQEDPDDPDDPDDPNRSHLLNYFYTHAILTDSNPAELSDWKTMLDQKRERHRQLSQQGYTNNSIMASIMQEQLASSNSIKLAPITRTEEKISRNSPCPCGSGKKYKRCCLNS